jgi:hypothetical protein
MSIIRSGIFAPAGLPGRRNLHQKAPQQSLSMSLCPPEVVSYLITGCGSWCAGSAWRGNVHTIHAASSGIIPKSTKTGRNE